MKHLFRGSRLVTFTIATALTSISGTGQAAPFEIREQNPLTLIYGLPTTTSSRLPEPGERRFHGSLNVSNTLHLDSPGAEQLIIDAETWVLNITADMALGQDWAVGLHLPLISHQGGTLDGFIEDFHDVFGLSQGDRLQQPQDRVLISYTNDGREFLRLDSAASGPGDLSLRVARQLQQTPDHSLSWWGSVKLPTGSERRLTGSGALDASTWVAGTQSLRTDWHLYGQAGVLLRGRGNVIADQQRAAVPFGSLGVEWHSWRSIALKVQLDAHGAFYRDTATNALEDSLQLTMGGTVRLSRNWSIDIGVGEDIRVESAPDVHLHIALRREQSNKHLNN